MRPNDYNGKLPLSEGPFRVLIISGSDRRQYNCPGVDSKSRTLMFRMQQQMPADWEVDIEDLGNVFARAHIQSCNACVSTSMALCVWPCNCYEPHNRREPDLMWNLDLYSRLDAWAIIGPVNWYSPTSNLKSMFDRLVCMNGGNPREDLIDHKDPELAMKLEHEPIWNELSINHLEGRTAGFFCHGDEGGDEIGPDGRPKKLRHKEYFDPDEEPFENDREAYAPLAWQCRYSGIEVPDALWRYEVVGEGKKYSDNQAEDMTTNEYAQFDAWVKTFVEFVTKKGKVMPGKYRAYGYKIPGHFWADKKLWWRAMRMKLGFPRKGSSPQKQQKLNLNHDTGLNATESEREKLKG